MTPDPLEPTAESPRGPGPSTTAPQIIGFGGCGADDRWFDRRIVRYLIRSSGRPHPRVGVISAAKGGPDGGTEILAASYRRAGATVTLLNIQDLREDVQRDSDSGRSSVSGLATALDIIHVEGGNLELLLERFRRSGLTTTLHRAWQAGVLLTGTSAGAACWFEHAIGASMFHGLEQDDEVFRLLEGIGFLPGVLCVHGDRQPERRRSFQAALRGDLEPSPMAQPNSQPTVSSTGAPRHGWALDHDAGLHFRGQELFRVVASSRNAGADEFELDDGGLRTQRHPGSSLGSLTPVEKVQRGLASLRSVGTRWSRQPWRTPR